MITYSKRELLNVIESYLAATGTSATAFGREAANDPQLMADLRSGRVLREATAHRVLDYVIDRLEQLTAQQAVAAEYRDLVFAANDNGAASGIEAAYA